MASFTPGNCKSWVMSLPCLGNATGRWPWFNVWAFGCMSPLLPNRLAPSQQVSVPPQASRECWNSTLHVGDHGPSPKLWVEQPPFLLCGYFSWGLLTECSVPDLQIQTCSEKDLVRRSFGTVFQTHFTGFRVRVSHLRYFCPLNVFPSPC